MLDQENPVIDLLPLDPAAAIPSQVDIPAQVDTAARLGLMIGDQRWLVDLSEAGEIVPVPDSIARVPLTREWLLGLVNLRGALYTVVDLQAYARLGRTDGGKDARLLALASRLNFNASIMVTRMMGLRNVSSMKGDDTASAYAPFGNAGRPEWVGNALLDADGNRWYELDLAKLAAGSDFLLVGR
ncbi:MAG: chemotaxis protein CheW [Burkholderiales bacterium]